nr:MAG TPA: hypothetical protein [Caudoviricetes sp.]
MNKQENTFKQKEDLKNLQNGAYFKNKLNGGK